MKTVNKTAKVGTAYGQTLAEELSIAYSYEELQKGDVIPTDEQLDEEDIRGVVNQKRNAAARAKATNAKLEEAGIQKPTLDDPNVQVREMVKVLRAADKNLTEEAANAKAKLILNIQ